MVLGGAYTHSSAPACCSRRTAPAAGDTYAVLVYKFALCLVIYPVRDMVVQVHLQVHVTGAYVAQLAVG